MYAFFLFPNSFRPREAFNKIPTDKSVYRNFSFTIQCNSQHPRSKNSRIPGINSSECMQNIFYVEANYCRIHPGRLRWNLRITHLERNMIFSTSVIMFHVYLQGCTNLNHLNITKILLGKAAKRSGSDPIFRLASPLGGVLILSCFI